MKKTLLSESNLSSCEVYYCHWCKEFGRKTSTLDGEEEHQDEQTEDESNISTISASDLSCSKCGRFLVRKGKVVDEASAGFTLKEVLTSFKPIPTTAAAAATDNNNTMSILSSSLTNSVLSSEVEDEAVNSNEVFILLIEFRKNLIFSLFDKHICYFFRQVHWLQRRVKATISSNHCSQTHKSRNRN